jgi:hypothetical protein
MSEDKLLTDFDYGQESCDGEKIDTPAEAFINLK